jgi:hypothetical protein
VWFLQPDWSARPDPLEFKPRTDPKDAQMSQLSRLVNLAALLMAVAFFAAALVR